MKEGILFGRNFLFLWDSSCMYRGLDGLSLSFCVGVVPVTTSFNEVLINFFPTFLSSFLLHDIFAALIITLHVFLE